jgi:threonine/homoserine efflux transporter RhtA
MNTEVKKSMSPYEWFLLVVLSILRGGSFFFVGVAVEVLPPFTIVALRVAMAALVLSTVVYFTELRLQFDSKIWVSFFGMGLLNNVIFFCFIV